MNKIFKSVMAFGLVAMLCVSLSMPVSAFTDESDLPNVSVWVNGAAATSDGTYLSDTWAIDKTGVSDAEYVLINQNGTEEMRVKNYPDDITTGELLEPEAYDVSFAVSVPKDVTNEVVVTLTSSAAEYTVSLYKDSEYLSTISVYPGEYHVSDIEVAGSDDAYSFDNKFSLKVTDKDTEAALKITNSTKKDEDDKGEDKGALGIVKGIDSNGDLLWDTIKLVLACGALFVVYILIQRKRKKKEEINN